MAAMGIKALDSTAAGMTLIVLCRILCHWIIRFDDLLAESFKLV